MAFLDAAATCLILVATRPANQPDARRPDDLGVSLSRMTAVRHPASRSPLRSTCKVAAQRPETI